MLIYLFSCLIVHYNQYTFALLHDSKSLRANFVHVISLQASVSPAGGRVQVVPGLLLPVFLCLKLADEIDPLQDRPVDRHSRARTFRPARLPVIVAAHRVHRHHVKPTLVRAHQRTSAVAFPRSLAHVALHATVAHVVGSVEHMTKEMVAL